MCAILTTGTTSCPGSWGEEVPSRQISPCVHAESAPHTWLSIPCADPTPIKSEYARKAEPLSSSLGRFAAP